MAEARDTRDTRRRVSFFGMTSTRLALLFLLVLVPFLATSIHDIIDQRRADLQRARDRLTIAAVTTVGEHRTAIDSSFDLLRTLALTREIRGENLAATRDMLSRLGGQFRRYSAFFRADGEMRIVATSLARGGERDVSDAPHVQQAFTSGRTTLSPYTVGPVTGEHITIITHPLLDEEGVVRGAVGCGLSLSWIDGFMRESGLFEELELFVFDGRGLLLAVHGADGLAPGDDVSIQPFFATALQGNGDDLRFDFGGEPYIGALGRDDSVPGGFHVLASQPERIALVRSSHAMSQQIALLAIMACLTLAAAALASRTLILKWVRAISGEARRLGDGDMSARIAVKSPNSEMGRLAESFNEMAERLEDRERKLAESEELFRDLSESVDEVFWVNEPGRMIYVSPAYEVIFGRSRETLYANPLAFMESIVEEDRERIVRAVERNSGQEDYLFDEEYRIRRPDGEIRWLWSRAFKASVTEDGGKRMVGIANDITERKQAEQQLKHVADSLARSQHVASLGSWEWLLDEDRMEWSDEAFRIAGVEPGSVEPTLGYLWSIIHDDDVQTVRSALEELVQSGEPSEVVFRVKRPDGEIRWVRSLGEMEKDCEGRRQRAYGTVQDITARHEMEQQLKRVRFSIDRVLDSVFWVKPDGRIVDVNDRAVRNLGYAREQLLAMHVWDLDVNIEPEDWVRTWREIRGRGNMSRESTVQTSWGDRIHVDVLVHHIEFGGEEFAFAVIRDITERKRTEALREDVERMTRHDLRSPLVSVVNAVRMLKSEPNLDADQKDTLRLVEDASYRMLNILNLSMGLYRMERGIYDFRPEQVDLAPLVRKVRRELAALAQSKKVAMELRIQGEPMNNGGAFWIRGEELLLYSMLQNLLRNAVEASPYGGDVVVDLARGEDVRVQVRNPGAVPVPMRERFFEKFATHGKQGGTGLGTYSVRLIARTHGGDASYETSEEEGTTVSVHLPL